MEKILKETVTQQERERDNMEKRENNMFLFNPPEIGKQNRQERQNEVTFTSFCVNDLQLPGDQSPKVDKVIQLRRPITESNAPPRPRTVFLKKS